MAKGIPFKKTPRFPIDFRTAIEFGEIFLLLLQLRLPSGLSIKVIIVGLLHEDPHR